MIYMVKAGLTHPLFVERAVNVNIVWYHCPGPGFCPEVSLSDSGMSSSLMGSLGSNFERLAVFPFFGSTASRGFCAGANEYTRLVNGYIPFQVSFTWSCLQWFLTLRWAVPLYGGGVFTVVSFTFLSTTHGTHRHNFRPHLFTFLGVGFLGASISCGQTAVWNLANDVFWKDLVV